MGMWLGIASGMGQRQHEEALQEVQQNSMMAKQLHEMYLKLAQRPDMRPEGVQRAQQLAIQALTVDPRKPNAQKQLEKLAQWDMTVEMASGTQTPTPGAPAEPAGQMQTAAPPPEYQVGAPAQTTTTPTPSMPSAPPFMAPTTEPQRKSAMYDQNEMMMMGLAQRAQEIGLEVQKAVATGEGTWPQRQRELEAGHEMRMEEAGQKPDRWIYGDEKDAEQKGLPGLPPGRYVFGVKKGKILDFYPTEEKGTGASAQQKELAYNAYAQATGKKREDLSAVDMVQAEALYRYLLGMIRPVPEGSYQINQITGHREYLPVEYGTNPDMGNLKELFQQALSGGQSTAQPSAPAKKGAATPTVPSAPPAVPTAPVTSTPTAVAPPAPISGADYDPAKIFASIPVPKDAAGKAIYDMSKRVATGQQPLAQAKNLAIYNAVNNFLSQHGLVEMSGKEVEAISGLRNSENILNQLQTMVMRVKENPVSLEPVRLRKTVQSIGSILARKVFMEVGVLTEGDVKRATGLLPGSLSTILSSPDWAPEALKRWPLENIEVLRELLRDRRSALYDLKTGKFGDIPPTDWDAIEARVQARLRGGAKRPKVTQLPNGKFLVEEAP